MFVQHGQGGFGAVCPQEMFIHAALGSVAAGRVRRCFLDGLSKLGRGYRQNSRWVPGSYTNPAPALAGQPAGARIHGFQQAHAKNFAVIKVHKHIAGMVIGLHGCVGQLGNAGTAVFQLVGAQGILQFPVRLPCPMTTAFQLRGSASSTGTRSSGRL